jgi:hypothetical protein
MVLVCVFIVQLLSFVVLGSKLSSHKMIRRSLGKAARTWAEFSGSAGFWRGAFPNPGAFWGHFLIEMDKLRR